MRSSGRGVWQKKETVEESHCLSIFAVKQARLLEKESGRWWDRRSNGATFLETEVSINQPIWPQRLFVKPTLTDGLGRKRFLETSEIRLANTFCRFGGKRWWFLCPGQNCGRRVAKLYFPPGKNRYLCRHCHGLSYEGRQKHRDRSYQSFGRFALYRKRAEKAKTSLQRARWQLRQLQAFDWIKAGMKSDQIRHNVQMERLRRRAGLPLLP
ncbi:MAG: hypothetical protein HY211_01080 [Candidatus Omnitrophica bacterium]|nr:hypothetical protein [Candidatus Omnitrophota bacterium]